MDDFYDQPKFPSSPKDSGDFPWNCKVKPLLDQMPNGKAWPKITVVTPNYNYGHFLEETIRSILLQGYPNLEYIIMDGGSTDQSIAVIEKYKSWINHWVSEKDHGQAHAINKGFDIATGDLMIWINSDDILLPEALRQIAEAYDENHEKLIFANVINFSPDGEVNQVIQTDITLENFIGIPVSTFRWHQPGMVVPRSFYKVVGGLDESLHYIFDWDWICRLLIHQPSVMYLNTFVTKFRVHDASKTGNGLLECLIESLRVIPRYNKYLSSSPPRKVAVFYHLKIASLYFCEHPGTDHYWNRYLGIKMLLRALTQDIKVIFEKQFVHLVIRAILPRMLYRSGSIGC